MMFAVSRAVLLTALCSALAICPAFAADKAPEKPETGLLVYDRDGNIYTSDLLGNGEVALTHDGDSHTPRWSPDGKQVLFIRDTSLQTVIYEDGTSAELGQPTDLYVVNRDGGNAHLIKHLDGVVTDPSWSPDGKTLGFFYQSKEEWLHQGIPSFTSGFFTLPSDGDGAPRLVSADARHVDWSPDGKKIVFEVARPGNHVALHTANADGGDETQLLDEETYVNAENGKWSPDGKQIAFQATVRRKMPDHKFLFQSTIFTVHPDGTHIREMTYDLGWDCWHPWWAPVENKLTYYCYAMPGCMPANAKMHPDQCIGRTFSVLTDDPYAKPNQTAEQTGIAGGVIPQIAPK